MIHHGDCLEVMAGMEPESVDAIESKCEHECERAPELAMNAMPGRGNDTKVGSIYPLGLPEPDESTS